MDMLITGASGLLGHHLITALQERGDHVRALVLPHENASRLEARGVTIYRGDIRKPETLSAPCVGVDTVFHLAGMMGLWLPLEDYRAVNATGAENMCRAAMAADVRRVVHVSSWTVYGMNLGRPATEEFPFKPFPEPYALSKTEGDVIVQRMIRDEGLRAAIIRPGTFFGPGDRIHFARMADRVHSHTGLVVGSGRNALPFVYVTDVVQGLMLLADKEEALGQAFNISNDHVMTQGQFLDAIAEELGDTPTRLYGPYGAMYAAAWAAEQVGAITHSKKQPIVTRLGVKLFGTDNRHSIDKARRLLGYEPRVSIREGVHLAAEWYKAGKPELTTAQVPVA